MNASARSFGWGHSILSHFSLWNASFDERIGAVASAGFDGFGFYIASYLELRERVGFSDAELRAKVDAHGISLAEIEVLSGWSRRHPDHASSQRWLEAACHMAEVFGSRHLVVIAPQEGSPREAAEDLGRVCDAAAEARLLVTIEFLPFTRVRTAADALALAEATRRDNCGVALDTWHHFRGANDWSLLEALPASRINCVQVNDGTLDAEHGDYLEDTLRNRRIPGRGHFDLDRFFGLLEAKDVDAPVSVDVTSHLLREAPAEDVAHLLHDALLAYYDA